MHNTSITVKTENIVKTEPQEVASDSTVPKTPSESDQGRERSPMFTPSPKRLKREPKTPKDSPIRGLPFSPSQVVQENGEFDAHFSR